MQTELLTKDGEKIVLVHDEPITEDELAVFRDLTVKEIKYILEQSGFKEFRYY
jgi:hypothetical protein